MLDKKTTSHSLLGRNIWDK